MHSNAPGFVIQKRNGRFGFALSGSAYTMPGRAMIASWGWARHDGVARGSGVIRFCQAHTDKRAARLQMRWGKAVNTNKVTIDVDDSGHVGLKCDCGNFESLKKGAREYRTFGYWNKPDTRDFEAHCKACQSEVHKVSVSPAAMKLLRDTPLS